MSAVAFARLQKCDALPRETPPARPKSATRFATRLAAARQGNRRRVAVHGISPWAARSRRPRGPGAGPRPAPCRRRIRPRVAGRPARSPGPGLAPARSDARPRRCRGPHPGRGGRGRHQARLRLLPEGSDVEGEDLVIAPVAEVRVLQRDGLEHSPARVDVLAVPPRGHLDHLGRAVDRGDRSRRQPLADQGDRDAVAATDLEQAVGRANLQSVDRPDKPLRCLARHAPAIAARCTVNPC